MEARHWKLVGKVVVIPASYLIGKEKVAALTAVALIGWLLYDLERVQLRRRPVLRTIMAVLLGTALLLLASCFWFADSWFLLAFSGLELAVVALSVWAWKKPEQPLDRPPRSLIDEYMAKGLPYMKRHYGGYLYEPTGTWMRPLGQNEEKDLWYIELDCGVSHNVKEKASVVFEMTELPQGVLFGDKPVRVRGRIKSFDTLQVILGRGNLFT